MSTLTFSGQRLRETCAAQGMTAQELAQRSGRSIGAIYTWRSGRARPGADGLAAIAMALAVPLESFYVRLPPPADERHSVPAQGRVS